MPVLLSGGPDLPGELLPERLRPFPLLADSLPAGSSSSWTSRWGASFSSLSLRTNGSAPLDSPSVYSLALISGGLSSFCRPSGEGRPLASYSAWLSSRSWPSELRRQLAIPALLASSSCPRISVHLSNCPSAAIASSARLGPIPSPRLSSPALRRRIGGPAILTPSSR